MTSCTRPVAQLQRGEEMTATEESSWAKRGREHACERERDARGHVRIRVGEGTAALPTVG